MTFTQYTLNCYDSLVIKEKGEHLNLSKQNPHLLANKNNPNLLLEKARTWMNKIVSLQRTRNANSYLLRSHNKEETKKKKKTMAMNV